MQAVRWHGNRDVRLDTVEFQAALGPGMVEVRVAFCGICGSDVGEFAHGPYAIRDRPHALSGQAPPVTLGHEFSGQVVAVGDGVAGVSVGDRVSADACWRCGVCPACRRGAYNWCPQGGSIGLCSDGAFAPLVRFPEYCAVLLPEAVTDRAGALLEPLAVALHAFDRAVAQPGETAVILGFGPIGAACTIVGEAIGLRCLVSEPNAARRERARALGLETLAPEGSPRDVAQAIRAATGGGSEIVVDATGVAAALENAPEMTVRGGRVVLVGIPKHPVSIDAGRLVLYERSIVATLGYVHDLPRVAAMIAAGRLDAEQLITRVVPLEQAPAELARLADDPGDDLKVLVSSSA